MTLGDVGNLALMCVPGGVLALTVITFLHVISAGRRAQVVVASLLLVLFGSSVMTAFRLWGWAFDYADANRPLPIWLDRAFLTSMVVAALATLTLTALSVSIVASPASARRWRGSDRPRANPVAQGRRRADGSTGASARAIRTRA